MGNLNENLIENIKNIDDHPMYYGSYLNNARFNILQIIIHLTERFKEIKCEKVNIKDDKINKNNFLLTVFNPDENIPDERRLGIFNYIIKRNFLPVLRFFENEMYKQEKPDLKIFFEKIHNFLTLIFEETDSLRNDYTHFFIIDKKTKEKIERKKSINKDLRKYIEDIFHSSFKYAAEQNSVTLKTEDFKHLEKYELFTETNQYTNYGFYFIACLFLERASAVKFLKKFKGFKNETTNVFKATIKAFTQFAVKIPRVKAVDEDKKLTLLMQMLNELNKCPKELYNHLSDEDKKEFEVNLEKEARINILRYSVNIDNASDFEIENALREMKTLKRHSDRFPYFALRYFDEKNTFQKIRFQISLGKIFIKEYPKTISGEEQNRRISKEIKTFGKLADFELKEDEILEVLKEKYGNDIYFEQYAPHYNMRNNKIAICFTDDKNNKNNFINKVPDAFLSVNALPKLLTLTILQRNGNIAEKKIKNFLNIKFDYETLTKIKNNLTLAPKEFTRRTIDDTKKNQNPAKQQKYIRLLKQRKEALNKELEQYNINAEQLPAIILDYLLEIKTDEKKIIHNRIKQMRFETKQLLKKIKKEIAKPEEEQKIKLGELATFLARDFINMVIDKDVKQKITSAYYNKLQNKLAFFSISKSEIINLCKELNLFNKNKGHVFLTENLINKSTGIVYFYINYLEEKQGIKKLHKTIKKGWFDKLQKHYKVNGKQKTDYVLNKPGVKIPYTYTTILKKTDFEKRLENINKMPVNLPANIFDKDIKSILKSKTECNGQKGFSQLLKKFTNNDSQKYYYYKRLYDKALPQKKGEKKNFKSIEINVNETAKEIKSKAGNRAKNNELAIRFHQTKDRLMKLMCEQLLSENKVFEEDTLIKLEDIYPKSETTPLDKPVSFSKKIKIKKQNIEYTVIANNKHKPEKQEGYTWTIKNFGKFSAVFKDKRLSNLLTYFVNNTNIPFEIIEHELNEYNRYREKVFEKIRIFEEAVYKNLKDDLIAKHIQISTYNHIQFVIYLDLLNEKNIIFNYNFLKEVRNRFAHGGFPKQSISGINKINKTEINDFMNKQYTAGYLSETYTSISKKADEKFDKEISNILGQLRKK